jgi:hypothetical protein
MTVTTPSLASPLELPLGSITALMREKTLLGQDHLRVTTADGDHVFAGGWDEWSRPLRRRLATDYGRLIVEETPEVWRVTSSGRFARL